MSKVEQHIRLARNAIPIQPGGRPRCFLPLLLLLSSLAILGYAQIIDTDEDGMPDEWEVQHGLDPRPVTDGLVGWWPLDEASGSNVTDRSTYGLNGNIRNLGTDAHVDALLGKGLNFEDGEGMNVVMGHAPQYHSATGLMVCTWYRPSTDNAPYNQTLIAKGGPWAHAGYVLSSGSGNSMRLYANVGGVNESTRKPYIRTSPSQWAHFAGVFDGAALRLYRDGIEEDQQSTTGLMTSTGHPLVLGTWQHPYNVRGTLDDVRVYARPLSASELNSLAEPGLDADGDGLINLDEYRAGTDPNNADN